MQRARIARDAFYKCAQMTVPDFDDRISPSNVIAKAVASKCQTWAEAVLRYMPKTEGADIYKEIMRGEEGNLLGIVLRNRVLGATPAAPLSTSEARPRPRQSANAQSASPSRRKPSR
jgi:hypothetical protein